MTNSNLKGKRGERAWRDKLREHGFLQAKRGQQHAGGADSPDVVCPELPSIQFEVKRTEKLSIYDAMSQAKRDAGDYKLPVVAHRRNNHDWLVIMDANDWLNLIKETDRVTSIFCPKCHGGNVKKDGITEKGKQRHECNDCKYAGWLAT
jgi:hypothetical protein